jgi:transposase
MRCGAGCNNTMGRRGHKHDPLYKIRGFLPHGVEHLTTKQQGKISRCLGAGDPKGERDLAMLPTAALHLPRHPGDRPPDRDQGLGQLPQLSHLRNRPAGRTLRASDPSAGHFDTHDVSNGGTEAINLIIERSVD